MDRLEKAVAAEIITEDQRRRIMALDMGPSDAQGAQDFRFSLVHLLWVAGVALVIVALLILADQLVDDANSLLLVSLVYAAGLLALDQVIKPFAGLRLLSSLLYVGVAVCAVIAVISLQYIYGAPKPLGEAVDSAFSHPDDPYSGGRLWDLIVFSFLPMALLPLGIAAGLLHLRSFLPAWLLAVPALFLIGLELMNFVIFRDDVLSLFDWFDDYVVAFGVATFGLGWWLDLRARLNHGFWLNKLALLLLWAWLLFQYEVEERETFVLLASVVLIFLAIFLRRPFGVPVGAGFVAIYIVELFDWWDNPLVVATFLAVIGGALIYWGVRAHLIENRLEALLPARLRALRPARRHDPVTFGY